MFSRTRITAGLGLGCALVVAAVAVGGFLGQPTPVVAAKAEPGAGQASRQAVPTPGPSGPGGRRTGPTREQMQQRHEQFMNRVAANLGVEPARLREAFKQSRIDTVNQMVQEGRLSREQADRLIQRINQSQDFGVGPPPGPRPRIARPGAGPRPNVQVAQIPPMGLAPRVIGIPPDELRAQLRTGKSLGEIAQERGISREELESKMLAAHQAEVDAAIARGGLTAEQAKHVTDRFAANLDRMLDAKPGQRRAPSS
jgi:AraC-like DNA-binding protein